MGSYLLFAQDMLDQFHDHEPVSVVFADAGLALRFDSIATSRTWPRPRSNFLSPISHPTDSRNHEIEVGVITNFLFSENIKILLVIDLNPCSTAGFQSFRNSGTTIANSQDAVLKRPFSCSAFALLLTGISTPAFAEVMATLRYPLSSF
jgi:hypothetical protein